MNGEKRKAESRKPGRRVSSSDALSALRSGISLIEILISMFVLLFGLMGVAVIFPVGNQYVVDAEKHDLGSSLAQNAFEELVARGMLRPEYWHYADPNGNLAAQTATAHNPPVEFNTSFIQPATLNGNPNANVGLFNLSLPGGIGSSQQFGPGHAFVLDPMATATALAPNPVLPDLDVFPYILNQSGRVYTSNPWQNILAGRRWPIRRLTVLDTNGLMSTAVAETIFRLRDDLAVAQPDEDDRPSIQNWDLNTATATPALLRRQYQGDYSWLATIVPTSGEALVGLQPEVNANSYGELRYDISVVVFRRREIAPTPTSERLVRAEFSYQGELVIYGSSAAEVDAAVDEIFPGNWIAVAGVNQTTGDFLLKWYRILALDKETVSEADANYEVAESGNFQMRYAMLEGPDWPVNSQYNLRAIILPGAISVATQQMHMEHTSLWSQE
ncbi:MAG: hypothetical protein KDA57_11520 [Planctomycetales bacterium]|nr:hypothetical protein [Planctomycetales bacterium]